MGGTMKPTEEQKRIIKDFGKFSSYEVREMFEKGEITTGTFLSFTEQVSKSAFDLLGINRDKHYQYYIYLVEVNGEPMYIGKGAGDRYKHAVSGRSTVVEINKHFFDGDRITVKRAMFTDSKEEVDEHEKMFISSLKEDCPEIYNKRVPDRNHLGWGYLGAFGDVPCIECNTQAE